MTFEIEWSLDYCLACDKQTSGGAYCCQSCRLADLETLSSGSEPVSPATPESSWPPSAPTGGAGLQLIPAFDFAAHKPPNTRSPLHLGQQASYFSDQSALIHATSARRALSPSISRSSLSSDSSKSLQSCQLSAQARTELRGYSNSFDLVRNWRRSMTSP